MRSTAGIGSGLEPKVAEILCAVTAYGNPMLWLSTVQWHAARNRNEGENLVGILDASRSWGGSSGSSGRNGCPLAPARDPSESQRIRELPGP